MKKLNFHLIILLTLSLFLSCQAQNNDENIKDRPNEAKKCIITASYEPTLYNGEWICGQEFKNYNDYGRDTTYFDEFDNELMVKKTFEIIRNVYASPKEQKIKTKYIISYSYDGKDVPSERFQKRIYVRNEKGYLIEIQEEDRYNSKESVSSIFTAKYDNLGNRIEEVDLKSNKTTTFNTNPPEANLIIKTYKTIDNTESEYYKGIQGLVASGITIIDSKTNLLQKESEESYSKGVLNYTDETMYFYTKNGKLSKTINNHISNRESTYDDGTSSREKVESKYIKVYNEHGEVILFTVYVPNLDGNLEITSTNSRKFSYTYNSHGDWIKRIAYPVFPDYSKKQTSSNGIRWNDVGNPNIPKEITIRKIEYYK